MPTTLFSVLCPLPSHHRQYVSPTPPSAALASKTVLNGSGPRSAVSPLRAERGLLPLFSTLAPTITMMETEAEMESVCKDFKVGSCKGEKLVEGLTMPLVLQPPDEETTNNNNNNNNDLPSLLRALGKNKDWFKQMIIKHSAVLLRGFNVSNAEDFNDVVEAFGWDNCPYVGPARRTSVYKGIWTANEGPLNEFIDFHHEMALMGRWPENVMFFCEVPPPEGGETPIGPSFRVAERLLAEFPEAMKEIEEKGLKYEFKTQPQAEGKCNGRSWQEFLGSSDPEEAVKKAKENADIDVEWLPNGGALLIAANRPLTVEFEGRKGRKAWFNLIHNKDIPKVTMMDGTEIPKNIVRRIREIFEEETIQFRWEKGDILFLDNLAAYHGRRPSLPPRRVLVAACKRV